MQRTLSCGISQTLVMVIVAVPLAVMAAGPDMMRSPVPADKLGEARALRSPLPNTPDMIEKGKALYHGKGTCFNCHGKDGDGDGVMAKMLDPAPRNFQHHGFWRHRTEGEIFWVIKNGSPGTSMMGFVGQLTDEEIWAIIQYERTFSRHRGMRGMHGRGPMGHGGRYEGQEQDRIDQPEEEEPEVLPKEEVGRPEKE